MYRIFQIILTTEYVYQKYRKEWNLLNNDKKKRISKNFRTASIPLLSFPQATAGI
jgi:hypothetical protein